MAKIVAGIFTKILIQLYELSNVKASPPKKIAATILVPKSLAVLVEMEFPAKPHTMVA